VSGDWRLTNQETYLAGRTLVWRTWTSDRPDWDHDHCSFCWSEISDQPVGDHVSWNAAWVTSDDQYHWVCPDCFNDFAPTFRWHIEEAPSG
jgi:hypothetical protein